MHKPRPFRYGALLRVRKIEEDQEAQKLAALQRARQLSEQRLASIRDIQRRMFEEAAQEQRSRFRASEIDRYYQYEQHMARQALEADADVEALRREEAAQREALKHALRQRRIVGKLKERRDEQWRAYRAHHDQRLSDETAVNQAAQDRVRRTS